MAQHHWLSQRAIVAQDGCFEPEGPVVLGAEKQRELALYMRYQTNHDRAFHKCQKELKRLQSNRRKAEAEQAKVKAAEAAEARKIAMHTVRLEIATLKRDRELRKAIAPIAQPVPEANAATTVRIAA